jgi:tetratricopeptide (TPR) repeat protein
VNPVNPNTKITPAFLNHPTDWISITTTETPYPKLYTQLKSMKYTDALHCIRFIQICLKSGHAEEGDEAIQYFKTNFQTAARGGLNALFLAVEQWYEFFIYHSERITYLESAFLENVEGHYAIETKYLGFYTLGFYHLSKSEFTQAQEFFVKLEQVYASVKLENVEDITTLRENLEVLLQTRDIDEVQAHYERNIGILSKNSLQNRVALIRLVARRGDYERAYELVKPFPALLLPKYTHLIVAIAAQKTYTLQRKKFNKDPDGFHILVLEGIFKNDPDMILAGPLMHYGKVNPRINATCRIGTAWAFGQKGLIAEALGMMKRVDNLPVEHDTMLFRHFTLLDLVIRFPDHTKDISIVPLVREILFHYQFIAKGKRCDNNLVPGYSEAIWFLACFCKEFAEYQQIRKTVAVFEKGILLEDTLYTTPIYKAIIERKTDGYTESHLKTARQRIKHRLESDKPLIVVHFDLLERSAPMWIAAFPEYAASITIRLTALAERANITLCLPPSSESRTSSSAEMPDNLLPLYHLPRIP